MTRTGDLIPWILTVFLSLFGGGVASAAPLVSVQSSVDNQKIGVGDVFTYTLSVVSNENVDIQEPRPPDLDGFELMDRFESTAVSQKMMQTPQGLDWQTQRKKDFNYRLRATRPGRQQIGVFEIVVDGKNHRTSPLVLDVAAQAQGRPRPPQAPPGFPQGFGFPGLDNLDDLDRAEEELFNQLLQQRQRFFQRPEPQHRSLPINPNEAFFVQVEVDKTEVYEGQQVTASWYIYTRGQMETLDRVKFPDLRGFWKEIIEEVPTIQFTEEIVNGIPYRKALIASHALFPLKAGTSVIDEYKIKSRVRLPLQGYGAGLGKPYEYTKTSQRVSIKVKPLPVEGRPSSFTGAVGVFDVMARVEQASVPVNQPFSLRIRFEGEGNAKGIELPAINWPTGIEVYDTKAESRFFKNGRSFKDFEVLLIPRQVGNLEIPSFSFAMFNPATQRYETRETAPVQIRVVENPNEVAGSRQSFQTSGGQAPTSKGSEGPRLPEPALRPSTAALPQVVGHPVFWAAIYLSVLFALLNKARLEFGWGRRRRDLRDLVAKKWKDIEKAQKSGSPRQLGAEMTNLFYLVLGEIAGGGQASEELAKVMERLPPSLRRDHGAEITKQFETFQILGFAPEEMLGPYREPEKQKQLVNEAKKLIESLVDKSGLVDNAGREDV